MLYAPAVCENCSAVFGSAQLIAESDGERASYRRSAGPCPRCGGRGSIPVWVFRFHTIASAAADRATPEQLQSLIQALRLRLDAVAPTNPIDPDGHLNGELTGPWSGVALELRSVPADQRTAQLTFLRWIVDRPERRHGGRDNGAVEGLPDTSTADMLDDAEDLGPTALPTVLRDRPAGAGASGHRRHGHQHPQSVVQDCGLDTKGSS
jgi:hypothetical protein